MGTSRLDFCTIFAHIERVLVQPMVIPRVERRRIEYQRRWQIVSAPIVVLLSGNMEMPDHCRLDCQDYSNGIPGVDSNLPTSPRKSSPIVGLVKAHVASRPETRYTTCLQGRRSPLCRRPSSPMPPRFLPRNRRDQYSTRSTMPPHEDDNRRGLGGKR